MKSSLYAATTTSAYSRALKWCNSTSQQEWPEKLKELSAMLEKIPHRGYTKGSLINPAEAESVYQGERNSRNSSYEIAGTVMEVDEGKTFTLLTQNAFEHGRTLEVLSFEGKVIEVSTNEMQDISRLPVLKAKPNRLLRFPYPPLVSSSQEVSTSFRIEPMNVVRLQYVSAAQ
jgi:hypothetical protein